MDDKEFIKIINTATERFHGNLSHLENAIGMLALGRYYGWRVLYLIHSPRTVKKYSQILDVDLRECLPEKSTLTHQSYAWKALQKLQGVKDFWKAVRGEIKGVSSKEAGDTSEEK